jgi:hypothetical protein
MQSLLHLGAAYQGHTVRLNSDSLGKFQCSTVPQLRKNPNGGAKAADTVTVDSSRGLLSLFQGIVTGDAMVLITVVSL